MKKQILILGLLMALSACASAPSGGITVESAWGRDSPAVAQAGAFYLVIRNTSAQADKLTAVKSDQCGSAEMHETYMTPEGAMGMRPVSGGAIQVPASGMVELKAGGLHIMCIQKKVEFKPGVKIPLTLTFEKAGAINVTVEIKDPAGM